MERDVSVSVLIVDDSAMMRNMIARIVDAADGLELDAKASNGLMALRRLETHRPDVIVLDLEMPEMNGIEFLKERKQRGIDIPVVILSSIARRGARITMEALGLGASDFILKPSGSNADELKHIEHQLVATLRAYGTRYQLSAGSGHRNLTTPGTRGRSPVLPKTPSTHRSDAIAAVAIGISTGGPQALRQVFHDLDPHLAAPVFVVQHMPAGFTGEFAESLNRLSSLEVKEAEAGDVPRPGRAFIAPGDRHMTVVKRRLAEIIALSDDPPMSGHRPSADVLFSSIAEVYGSAALAVIMTGMGRDGAEQIGAVRRAGGITVGQDEASSVVYGMPRVAAERGHLTAILPLDAVAGYINRTVGHGRHGDGRLE